MPFTQPPPKRRSYTPRKSYIQETIPFQTTTEYAFTGKASIPRHVMFQETLTNSFKHGHFESVNFNLGNDQCLKSTTQKADFIVPVSKEKTETRFRICRIVDSTAYDIMGRMKLHNELQSSKDARIRKQTPGLNHITHLL